MRSRHLRRASHPAMLDRMRPDPLLLDESDHPFSPPPAQSRLEKDAVLLALSGGSVVDWSGVSFRSREEVNNFLRLWHCDVERHPWAQRRLHYIYNQAVVFLEEQLGLTFRSHIRRLADVRDAFVGASKKGFGRDRIQYCAILKLMHVVNHLEMQELRNSLPIREVDLLERANLQVLAKAEEMRACGFPLRAFYGNRKARPSVISKLLAKREATAAPIFDKLRFRLVTERREHLVDAIAWLFRNLIPFPAIIPGESHNNLLDRDEVLRATDAMPELDRILSKGVDSLRAPANGYSGASYRVVNFVVDLPVRVYDLPGIPPSSHPEVLGEAVPIMVEFQLLDAETDQRNEQGESRHDLYKARQIEAVYSRLGRSIPRLSRGIGR